MKLQLLNRNSLQNNSFTISDEECSHFLRIWHYHQELELVLLLESSGIRFIGDSIEKFGPGEVILIGENLPHMWVNEKEYFKCESNLKAKAVTVHFKKEFLGESFFSTPEMLSISELLYRSRRGIIFKSANLHLKKKLACLSRLEPFDRTIGFIEILYQLSRRKDYRLLTSIGFVNSLSDNEQYGMNLVYEFIFENFRSSIKLQDVAKIANMNASAFSRAFKRVQRKTFTRYLTEIRLGYACKLLLEKSYSIKQVCYESGFNNISNFNLQFKRIKGISPTEFIKKYSLVGD